MTLLNDLKVKTTVPNTHGRSFKSVRSNIDHGLDIGFELIVKDLSLKRACYSLSGVPAT